MSIRAKIGNNYKSITPDSAGVIKDIVVCNTAAELPEEESRVEGVLYLAPGTSGTGIIWNGKVYSSIVAGDNVTIEESTENLGVLKISASGGGNGLSLANQNNTSEQLKVWKGTSDDLGSEGSLTTDTIYIVTA